MSKTIVRADDFRKTIARSTTLTVAQVNEVFDVLGDTLLGILTMENCPDDVEIKLGKIGKLYLCPYEGRKAGVVYKIPRTREIDGKKKTVMEDLILEEDEPDFVSPKFKLNKSFVDAVKEKSRDRSRKKKLRSK